MNTAAAAGATAGLGVAEAISSEGAEGAELTAARGVGSQAGAAEGVRTAASAPRIANFPTGFSTGSRIIFGTTAEVDQTLDSIVAARATWVRLDVNWYWVQPTSSTAFDWSRVDYMVSAAESRGLSILGILLACPTWAALNGSSGTSSSRPKTAALYATFAGKVAARYKGRIDAYEIWNEPNSREFFAPDPDPAFYAAMVKAAYSSIRSVDPAAVVVAGALGPAQTGDGTLSPITFVNQMYAAGAAGSFDAFSFHPYEYDDDFSAGCLWDTAPMRLMIGIHAIMKSKGDGAKKIWVTEYGVPTGNGRTESAQSDLITSSMQSWAEVDYAGPFFVYTVRDGAGGYPDSFGVVTDSFAAKQALWGIEYLQENGMPPRQEAQAFDSNPDSTLGASVSPVYPIGTGYAQELEKGTRWLTNSGWFSSPTAVGTAARALRTVPTGPLVSGRQNFEGDGGVAIFYSAATGAHAVYGGVLAAYTPKLGLATSDMNASGSSGGVAVDFQKGRIVWSPSAGATVTS